MEVLSHIQIPKSLCFTPRASLKQRKHGRNTRNYKGIQFMDDTQAVAYTSQDAFLN